MKTRFGISSRSFNPNVFRHLLSLDFLKNADNQIPDVFLIDISEVGLMRNPFGENH